MTNNRVTDEVLIKEFQNGNRNSYTQLVTRYRDKIISFLYRYMHDMDSAEDLAQETFFKVYLKKDSYKETYKFSTWLFTIAANLAKTELRKLKRRKTSSISDINEDGTSENIFIDEDNTEKSSNNESKIIQKALSELEHDYKIIIILREIQELSYDVISKILQLPLGTVKSRINRGKLKLREILINYGVKNYK
ncbi:MAG: RNA polymerase subunit sigma-24 [Candidatus Marinimicrobia bacterium]|nr:RNA polymerase subunit sigma-24 [Candidatus Neomarinimicrobiota bacterium]